MKKKEESIPVPAGTVFGTTRKSLGLTQKDISLKSGIAQGDISRIESGLANPSLKTMTRLADALGMELCIKLVKKK